MEWLIGVAGRGLTRAKRGASFAEAWLLPSTFALLARTPGLGNTVSFRCPNISTWGTPKSDHFRNKK